MVDNLDIELFDTSYNNDLKWRLIGDTIEQAITYGISQSSTAQQLRDKGFSFGNTPFNQLFRDKRDYRVGFEYISTLDDDELPNPLQISTKDWLETGRYQYVYEFEIYDSIADETIYYRTAEFLDDLLTKGQAEGILESLDDFTSAPANVDIVNAKLIGAFRGIG